MRRRAFRTSTEALGIGTEIQGTEEVDVLYLESHIDPVAESTSVMAEVGIALVLRALRAASNYKYKGVSC